MYSIEQFKALTVPASMVITQHSRKRFAERHIMIQDVCQAIQTGRIIEQYPDDFPLSSLFSLVRRRHEKESFPFVSGRSGKHFIANQLLDSFFQTRAALRVELQEDGVCSAANAENKRRLLSCLWFFDNRGIVHVGQ